jgi:hypothetical protein
MKTVFLIEISREGFNGVSRGLTDDNGVYKGHKFTQEGEKVTLDGSEYEAIYRYPKDTDVSTYEAEIDPENPDCLPK